MKRFSKKIAVFALSLSLCLAGTLSFGGCDQKAAQKSDDTEFVILMFSDLHLDNTENYEKRAFKTIDDLVAISCPDLIIMTGDLTGVDDDNEKAFRAFGEKMESYNIPWTFVFGNHDSQGTAWSRTDIANYLAGLDNCVFELGPEEVYGAGNNYFNVTDEKGKIIQTIFTLDTSNEQGGTHFIDETQIEWYKQVVKDVAVQANGDETKVVPSIIFAHIPMIEYEGAYNEAVKKGTVIYGKRGEKECPDPREDQLFKTIVEMGSTTAYYCGHEHLSNYVVEKDGIRMTYTETCDHKMYIPSRGGLIINIKKDGKVTQQNVRRSRFTRHYKISEEY